MRAERCARSWSSSGVDRQCDRQLTPGSVRPQSVQRNRGSRTVAPPNSVATWRSRQSLTWHPPPQAEQAGAFFLGAPLAIDNTLYVMAEIRSALYLVALDPATGQVQWQQQLLGLEQSIGRSTRPADERVSHHLTPAASVCPTGAGTIVAIDVVKREFAWVYGYPAKSNRPRCETSGQTKPSPNWCEATINGSIARP